MQQKRCVTLPDTDFCEAMKQRADLTDDVSMAVDGSGVPSGNYDRVSVGYDWIDLADYDATLFDKTVKVFNTYMANQGGARFFLGWAEILRKKSCTAL
jgi:hypothetical protein